MKIYPEEAQVFDADGRTDHGQTWRS